MSLDELRDIFNSAGPHDERVADALDKLAAVLDRLMPETVDTILAPVASMAPYDRQTAKALLETYPSVIEALLPRGERVVVAVLAIACECLPYGVPLAVRMLAAADGILADGDLEILTKTAALASSVAQVNAPTAEAIVDETPALLQRIGFEGLHAVAVFASICARSSWTYAVKVVDASPAHIDRLKAAGADDVLIIGIYRLAADVCRTDWSVALALLEKSASVVGKLEDMHDPGFAHELYARVQKIYPFHPKLIEAFLETAPGLLSLFGDAASIEPIWQCAFGVAEHNPDHAASLLRDSFVAGQALSMRFNSAAVGRVFASAQTLCAYGSSLPARYLSAVAASSVDEEAARTIAGLAGEIAAVSLKAAEALLKAAPAVMARQGLEDLKEIQKITLAAVKESWEAATALALHSPDLIERVEVEGVKLVADFVVHLARQNVSEAVRLTEKCPHIIDGLLAAGGIDTVREVCRLAGVIVAFNARTAAAVLLHSADVINLAGLDGLAEVADMAHTVGEENWTASVSLVEASPQIVELIGLSGLRQVALLAAPVARHNSYGAVSLLEKIAGVIRSLRGLGDESVIFDVLDAALSVAGADPQLAKQIIDTAWDMVDALGVPRLKQLVKLAGGAENTRIAGRLLKAGTALFDQLGLPGLRVLRDLALLVDETDPLKAVEIVEKSPLLVERLGEIETSEAGAAHVYELAAVLARTSVPVAVRFIETSPHLMRNFGHDGLPLIAATLAALAGQDEQKALAALAADDTVLSDFAENIPKGIELKAVKPLLSKYLQALLGRRVEIGETGREGGADAPVVLPKRVRDFRDDADNFILYKVAATHQEAHLEYGSEDFDIDSIPQCLESISRRYGITAADSGSSLDRFVNSFPEPQLARDLFIILEDFRIELILKREYPALGKDIMRVNRHLAAKKRPPGKIKNSKERAVEMIAQTLSAGKSFKAEDAGMQAVLQQLDGVAYSLQQAGADVHDAACVAAALYAVIDERFPDDPYRPVKSIPQHRGQDSPSRNLGSFSRTARHIRERIARSSPAAQGGRMPAIEAPSGAGSETTPASRRPEGESSEGRHRSGAEQSSFMGPQRGGKLSSASSDSATQPAGAIGGPMKCDSPEKIERLLKSAYREKGLTPKEVQERFDDLHPGQIFYFLDSLGTSLEGRTELQPEKGAALYPEWNEAAESYRDNWAKVREQRQPPTSLVFYQETLDKHAGLLKKIRREFQLLRPEGFRRLKRQFDGDDIDFDQTVEYLIDLRIGLSPAENNYRLTRRKKRDIACAFLIDMSRSTRGAVIAREKEALIIMAEALREVGDTFAVFGFSGDNRENVDYYIIKSFDDAYDNQAKKRISAVEDHYENRDGAAIRHTAHLLKKRQERTKLIILLSDGKPVDKAYSGNYAVEDTRMSLKEARREGIKTFCITMDQNAPEYLPRMYSFSNWTVIDDVSKLPEKITRIYRMLTS